MEQNLMLVFCRLAQKKYELFVSKEMSIKGGCTFLVAFFLKSISGYATRESKTQ